MGVGDGGMYRVILHPCPCTSKTERKDFKEVAGSSTPHGCDRPGHPQLKPIRALSVDKWHQLVPGSLLKTLGFPGGSVESSGKHESLICKSFQTMSTLSKM